MSHISPTGAEDIIRQLRPHRPLSTSLPAGRFYRLTGHNSASSPTAGQAVDGSTWSITYGGGSGPEVVMAAPAARGLQVPVRVGSGGITSGDDVATDGSGRAVTAGAGDAVVARALESAGGGSVAWVVMS